MYLADCTATSNSLHSPSSQLLPTFTWGRGWRVAEMGEERGGVGIDGW